RPSTDPSPLQVHFASPSPSLSPCFYPSPLQAPGALPPDRRPPHEGQGIRRRRRGELQSLHTQEDPSPCKEETAALKTPQFIIGLTICKNYRFWLDIPIL
ncbi:hypothetical protein ZEAMMB73_Zm00001d018636, partial [Zea mays]